jgi:hypothetical protein
MADEAKGPKSGCTAGRACLEAAAQVFNREGGWRCPAALQALRRVPRGQHVACAAKQN